MYCCTRSQQYIKIPTILSIQYVIRVMSSILQAYCKLSCFKYVKRGQYNICKCYPFCAVLNNTMSKKSSAYLQGENITHQMNDCDCVVTCKKTNTSLNWPSYKQSKLQGPSPTQPVGSEGDRTFAYDIRNIV